MHNILHDTSPTPMHAKPYHWRVYFPSNSLRLNDRKYTTQTLIKAVFVKSGQYLVLRIMLHLWSISLPWNIPDDVCKDFFLESGYIQVLIPSLLKPLLRMTVLFSLKSVPLVHQEMYFICVDSIVITLPTLISGGCLLLSLVCVCVCVCVLTSSFQDPIYTLG